MVLNGGHAIFWRYHRQKLGKMGGHGNSQVGYENLTSEIKILIT
jgi:hypothetical protein